MDDFRETIRARLQETFKNDTQETIARKLNTTQGNVSKWLNGQIPTTDNLLHISKMYKVSVDWLLGISNEKQIDGVALEKLTYEDIALIIDRLLELGVVQIPDLNMIGGGSVGEERIDTDYIKINDRTLSFILRRRHKIYEVGPDMVDFWKQSSLPRFSGLRLLRYTQEIDKLMGSKDWVNFTDGDWVALVRDIEKMSDEEILIELSKTEKKEEKDG